MGLSVSKQKEIRDGYYKFCENVPEWVFAYLAGFLDGEGSIMADRRKVYNKNKPNRNGHQSPTISVKVCNTDPNPLYLFSKHFGGVVYKEPPVEKSNRNKDIYTYKAAVNSSWVLLDKLLPYLITKRPQAEIALKLYQYASTIEKNKRRYDTLIPKLVEEVANLNSRHHVKDIGNYNW